MCLHSGGSFLPPGATFHQHDLQPFSFLRSQLTVPFSLASPDPSPEASPPHPPPCVPAALSNVCLLLCLLPVPPQRQGGLSVSALLDSQGPEECLSPRRRWMDRWTDCPPAFQYTQTHAHLRTCVPFPSQPRVPFFLLLWPSAFREAPLSHLSLPFCFLRKTDFIF